MGYSNDDHQQVVSVNFVNHSIHPHTNPPSLLSLQLQASVRARIVGQISDRLFNAECILRWQPLQLSAGGWHDPDFVSALAHALSDAGHYNTGSGENLRDRIKTPEQDRHRGCHAA